MQADDPELYSRLHSKAYEVFERQAFHPSNLPLRTDCFIESLYHYAQKSKSERRSEQSRRDFTVAVLNLCSEFLHPLDGESEDSRIDRNEILFNRFRDDMILQRELNFVGESDTWKRIIDQIEWHKSG